MTFKKAVKTQAKLKLAITGPSGAGKTFSSILIAAGMGKRIAVIDTENGSASLYANQKSGPLAGIEFDVLELSAPYEIKKYLEALKAAQAAKYDVLVIDSISHAWAGDGGLLSKKEGLDARGGNSYTNWASITKEQEAFKAALISANLHLIATMRSKQDYVMETNDRGKQAPKKVGLAPVQREGMEYEFTTVLDLGMTHEAQASKDRTGLFDGQIFKPTRATGEALMAWLNDAAPAAPAEVKAETTPAALTQALPEDDVPTDWQPKDPEIRCGHCADVLRPHANKLGLICPNATARNDGHSRLTWAEIKKLNEPKATAQTG